MFRQVFASFLLVIVSIGTSLANNKIKCYFTRPVDNSVSTGTNALNISGRVDDTLVAAINKAKYTIDVAVYNCSYNSSTIAPVINAINSAWTRGVKVRWIYDGSQTNSALSYLNTSIPKLASPTSSAYTIMHNKFMVVDANSPNAADALVWTGATNWGSYQFDSDYNNIVVIQDTGVAKAYRDEFNMMWGDTGMVYSSARSRFGHTKTTHGNHIFNVDGTIVEVYFSPADTTNNKIIRAINSADKDLYVSMFTFTFSNNANAIMARKSAGVYCAVAIDSFSTSTSGTSPYMILSTGLGSNFKRYIGTNVYHNKYLIADPSDKCSDPLVLTGSHNWSVSANTDNDENTVIIHDASIANQYYQAFKADFNSLGGSLTTVTGCPTGVNEAELAGEQLAIFPNPVHGKVKVILPGGVTGECSYLLTDLTGRVVQHSSLVATSTSFDVDMSFLPTGCYVLSVHSSAGSHSFRVVVY